MPTLEELEQALTQPRRVDVESSPELIKEIEGLHKQKDTELQQKNKPVPERKQTLTVVADFSPTKQVDIVPAFLLLRLGVVTTPAIENLADICSTWARLRYLWAFELPQNPNVTPPLKLSQEAKKIDFHQKGLLSDEIGVGMAALLLGSYFNAPEALDVSIAVRNGKWGVQQQGKSSPDYLFFDSTQTNLYVVECKGTQSSRSESLSQLRRGTEQVKSLLFDGRPTPPSLIIATCLSRTGTRVLMLDPPGDDDQGKHIKKAERISSREWRIQDENRFSQSTRFLSQAKMLSFAGDDELATAKVEAAEFKVPRRRLTPRTPEITENELGRFRGVRQALGFGDRMRIDIFQGIESGVYESLRVDNPAGTHDQTAAFWQRIEQLGRPNLKQPVLVSRGDGSLTVKTAGPDGSMLELRIAAP